MSDYVLNIDSSYIDSDGNYLLLSDNISSLCTYSPITETTWSRNFLTFTDIWNPERNGQLYNGWVDSSDATVSGSYTVIPHYGLINLGGDCDLLRSYYPTFLAEDGGYVRSGYPYHLQYWPIQAGNLPEGNTSWHCWSFLPPSGNRWFSSDLGESRRFNSIFVDWAGDEDPYYPTLPSQPMNAFIKGYRIQVSDDNITYTTVISGSAYYGQTTPNTHIIESIEKRYIRVRADENWGNSVYGKMCDITLTNRENPDNKPGIMLWRNAFQGVSSSNYGQLSKEINLSNVNRLFIWVGGYTNSNTSYRVKVFIDNEEIYSKSGTSTYTYWNKYLPIDVEDYVGLHEVKVRISGVNGGRSLNHAWVRYITTIPSWYSEELSENRGSSKKFPDNVEIISDQDGLSIIELGNYDNYLGFSPDGAKLWMRFIYDSNNYLEYVASDVSAIDGVIYVSTYNGIYAIDFVNDCVDKYTTTGHYRKSSIALRNVGTNNPDDLDNPYNIFDWETISTASSVKLPSNVVNCMYTQEIVGSEGSYVLGGTDSGAFCLVSGTVYASLFTGNVNSISATQDAVAFSVGKNRTARVGLLFNTDYLGTDSFDVDYIFNQNVDDFAETYSEGFSSDNWVIKGSRYITPIINESSITVSGTPMFLDSGSGHISIALKDAFADRPFKAEAYVKIKEWPVLCPGEVRFGVFNGKNVPSFGHYGSDSRGIYLSARNDHKAPYPVYNTSFTDGFKDFRNSLGSPIPYNTSGSNTFSPVSGQGLFCFQSSASIDFVYALYTYDIIPNSKSFSLKFKVKNLYYTSSGYKFWLGVSHSVYTDYYNSSYGLFFCFSSSKYSIYRNQSGVETFTDGVEPFENDGTSRASWHDVYLIYDGPSKTLSGWIDDIFLGSLSTTDTHSLRIRMGSGGKYAYMVLKDFIVDWFDDVPTIGSSSYSVCKKTGSNRETSTSNFSYVEFPWGSSQNTYVKCTGAPFFGTEGTESEDFRKWEIYYNPDNSSLSCYIDNTFIGTSNLEYGSSRLDDINVGFDIQFMPQTTTSGLNWLDLEVKGMSVTYSGTGKEYYHNTNEGYQEALPGSVNSMGLSTSALTAFIKDVNVVVGTDEGISKISAVKPQYISNYLFSSGGIPTGWEVNDMPGVVGVNNWTVASGVLKQGTRVYGNGGSISDDGKYSGPFGTHLLTNISCNRIPEDQQIVGKTVFLNIRTTSSGVIGVGYNEVFSVVGTVTSGSGKYVSWVNGEIRVGDFESVYDSSTLLYRPSYSVDFTKSYDGSIIGSPHTLGLSFDDVDTVSIYIDGIKQFETEELNNYKKQGYISIISNNNNNCEVSSIKVYDNSYILPTPVSETYSTNYGDGDYKIISGGENKISSVLNSLDVSRESGLIEVGSSEGSFVWRKLEPLINSYFSRVSRRYVNFMYDKVSNSLLGIYLLSQSTSGYNNSCVAWGVKYDLDRNAWSFFPPFQNVLAVGPTTGHTRSVLLTFSLSITDVYYYYIYSGEGKYAYSPADNLVYVLGSYAKALKVDLENIYNSELWGDITTSTSAAVASTLRNYADLPGNTWGWESDCFLGSNMPSLSKPTFCWYNGSIIMSKRRIVYRPRYYQAAEASCGYTENIGVQGDVLWTFFPSSGRWSQWNPGIGSLDGFNIHPPPFGYTAATDEAVRFCKNQAITYCEFNDSVYVLRFDTLSRLDIRKNAWYLCSTPPFSMPSGIADTSRNSSDMIYVFGINKIFVINYTDGFIYIYDVVLDEWISKITVPEGTNSYSHMEYASDINKVFVSSGISSTAKVYELSVPNYNKVVSFDYSVEKDTLPEESSYGRFHWCGPDNFIVSDSFEYDNYKHDSFFTTVSGAASLRQPCDYPQAWAVGSSLLYRPAVLFTRGWVDGLGDGNTHLKSYIGGTYDGGSYVGKQYMYSQVGGISSRVPIRANDFTATLDVKYAPSVQVSGAAKFYRLFGVSQGNINNGGLSNKAASPARMSSRGLNGIYMCTVDHASYPKRYSIVKRDGSSWDESNFSSNYIDGYIDDGQVDSPYRQWKIVYSAESQRLDAYIDGVYIGHDFLLGEMEELFLEIGYAYPHYGTTTGHIETFIKNLSVDFNAESSTHYINSGSRLCINKRSLNNRGFYYERSFSELESNKDFIYETKVEIPLVSISNTPYVLSIGRIQDGNKDINLCALLDTHGSKKIGFWSGGNPWLLASGYINVVEFDWNEDTIYRIVKDSTLGTIDVFTNDDSLPIIEGEYSLFPEVNPNVSITSFNTSATFRRSVSFGVIDIDRELVETIDPAMETVEIKNGGYTSFVGDRLCVEGTWVVGGTPYDASYSQIDRSCVIWNTSYYYAVPDVGNTDEYVRYIPSDLDGYDCHIYMHPGYVYSNRATDTPITIYHSGAVDLPVPDSYATNNIVTVAEDTDHTGVTTSGTGINATTIDIDCTRYYNGYSYDFSQGTENYPIQNGLVYLGTYTNVTDVYITRDCAGSYVDVGPMFFYKYDRKARLKSSSTSYWSYVRIFSGAKEFSRIPGVTDVSGFSIIDTEGKQLVDYYGDNTIPPIISGNIKDIDKY